MWLKYLPVTETRRVLNSMKYEIKSWEHFRHNGKAFMISLSETRVVDKTTSTNNKW